MTYFTHAEQFYSSFTRVFMEVSGKMVNYVGLSELELPAGEQRHVHMIVERQMMRIRSIASDVIDARVRIKRIWKGGGMARYEISVGLLTSAGPRYAASSSWTLPTAVQNAFESIEHQLSSHHAHEHQRHGREVWSYPTQVV